MLSGDSALKDGKDMDGLGIRRTDLPDTSVALYRREDDKSMNRRTVVVFGYLQLMRPWPAASPASVSCLPRLPLPKEGGYS